jgi:hypothetical protein
MIEKHVTTYIKYRLILNIIAINTYLLNIIRIKILSITDFYFCFSFIRKHILNIIAINTSYTTPRLMRLKI